MARTQTPPFNPQAFLAKVDGGKTSLTAPKKHTIFAQGDAAEAVFYIQTDVSPEYDGGSKLE